MRGKVLIESYPPPPPPPPPPQSPLKGQGKHPKAGLIMLLVGVILIIFEALSYFLVGIALVGILGIIFAALSIFFGYRGYLETENKKRAIYSLIPELLGMIVMVSAYWIYVTLPDTLIIIFGGLLLMLGAAFISSGK